MENGDKKGKSDFLGAYVRMLLRHKFLIIIPLIAAFLGATIVGSSLPKVYKARGVFLIVNQPVAERSKPREAISLQVMREIILSRANLVEIIKDIGLDAPYRDLPEPRREFREEEVVQRLRKNLDVQEKAKNVFEVSHKDANPDIVHRVVNAVIDRYISEVENLERTSLAGQIAFLQQQEKEYEGKVAKSSRALEEFKARHILELPGTDLAESAELRRILDDLRAAEEELSSAQEARKETEKQIAAVEPEMVGERVIEANPMVATYRAKLNELELQLNRLLLEKTERHPDVIKVRNEIESIKSLIVKVAKETTTTEKHLTNPLYLRLQENLRNAEVRIASAIKRKERLLEKRKECEDRVKNSPALENEKKNLEEADAENRTHLAYYKTQLMSLRIDQQREKSEKASRLQVQDYARRPTSPEQSNRLKVALLGLILGGGLGLGLIFVRDKMDSSFKDVEDAASFLDIPIVGTIPVINTMAEKASEKRRETLGWIVVSALVFVLGIALILITLGFFERVRI